MISNVLYTVALIFYMQALPIKLVVFSILSNVVVLGWKFYMGETL